jgi:hypothetical protein
VLIYSCLVSFPRICANKPFLDHKSRTTKISHYSMLLKRYQTFEAEFFSYFNFSICEFRDLKVYFFPFILWQYHGSFSLRHWLRQSDWLPILEATLALDEESVRRVGDDTVGGPAVSRQLRITRILMRDLLIGVCIS